MHFDPWSCLSFDVACIEFDERFTLEQEATKEVALTPEERKRDYVPTKTVAVHDHATLLRLLGLPGGEGLSDDQALDTMASAADWFRAGGLGE